MKKITPIYISAVFISLHYAAILYVNSSYLGQFFSSKIVNALFLAGALGNIVFFFWAARLLRWFGPRLLLLFFLSVLSVSTLVLGFGQHPTTIAIAFVTYSSVFFMTYWCLDIFLENISIDSETGSIRGAYLTYINTAVASAPLLLTFFATEGKLSILYLLAFLLLIPPILLSMFSFKLKEVPKKGPVAHLPFVLWWQRKNVRRVTVARFLLNFFYAFMIIYTPVYLHQYLGFDWSELGVMFTIMLLPFIFLQWPVGKLADLHFGEKEIMFIGFVIMIISLLLMPVIDKTFIAWVSVLFVSRVGASLIEVTTESYFFKHIGVKDAGLISIFHLTRPASIILGSIAGALSIFVFSYSWIFWTLAFFVSFGLVQSISLRDTK